MNYGRIRRGPMAADAFTQIRNAVFRDARLSAKAMGIFGNISTHRDGWGITPESISTQMRDGVDSIKAGLRELERCGYLQRIRERRPDGTLGASVYFITDQPEAIAAFLGEETPSVEPEGDFPPLDSPPQAEPPVDEPPEAEPPVVDPPHKNINSKHTSSAEHSLSRTAAPKPAAPAAPKGEREIAAPDNDATQVAIAWRQARGGAPVRRTEAAITAQAAQLLADGHQPDHLTAVAAWMASRGYTDLERALTHREAPKPAGTPVAGKSAQSSLPDWCGHCNDQDPTARFNPRLRLARDGAPCPACHPNALAAA